MDGVTVTRIGTQVVVRLSGHIDDAKAGRLAAAVDEIETLALHRVVVDLDDLRSIQGCGLDFIATLHGRWRVLMLNTPADLRAALPRRQAKRGDHDRHAMASPMSSTVDAWTSEST